MNHHLVFKMSQLQVTTMASLTHPKSTVLLSYEKRPEKGFLIWSHPALTLLPHLTELTFNCMKPHLNFALFNLAILNGATFDSLNPTKFVKLKGRNFDQTSFHMHLAQVQSTRHSSHSWRNTSIASNSAKQEVNMATQCFWSNWPRYQRIHESFSKSNNVLKIQTGLESDRRWNN